MFDNILENIDKEKEKLLEMREKYKNSIGPGVSIIAPTFKSGYISNIFDNYRRLDYPTKELIIILNSNKLDTAEYYQRADKYENVSIFQLNKGCSLGECLNFGIGMAKYDYISRMDDDDYYGPNYLTDLMSVFNYEDVQMTGKNPIFVYFEDNNSLNILKHDNPIMGATFLFKKEVFNRVRFRSLSYKEDCYFLMDCVRAGVKIIAADKFNFVYIRHSNLKDHTFRIPSAKFLELYDIQEIVTVQDFISFTTV